MGEAGKITAALTETKGSCVGERVRRSPNPILYLSQPALLYVTAETLVNRLMWQISRAILLFNPIIPASKRSYGKKRR